MFQLSLDEGNELLRSQIVTLKQGQHLKYAPLRMRETISTNTKILRKVEDLERKVSGHDRQLQQVFQAIRDLIQPAIFAKRPIGIRTDK